MTLAFAGGVSATPIEQDFCFTSCISEGLDELVNK